MKKTQQDKAIQLIYDLYYKASEGRSKQQVYTDPVLCSAWSVISKAILSGWVAGNGKADKALEVLK